MSSRSSDSERKVPEEPSASLTHSLSRLRAELQEKEREVASLRRRISSLASRKPLERLPSRSAVSLSGLQFNVEESTRRRASFPPEPQRPPHRSDPDLLFAKYGITQEELSYFRRFRKLMRVFSAPQFDFTQRNQMDPIANAARDQAPDEDVPLRGYFEENATQQEQRSTRKLMERYGMSKEDYSSFQSYHKATKKLKKVLGANEDLPDQDAMDELRKSALARRPPRLETKIERMLGVPQEEIDFIVRFAKVARVMGEFPDASSVSSAASTPSASRRSSRSR